MGRSGREVVFEVEQERLVRHVSLPDGRRYTQRAPLATIQKVAWIITKRADEGVTLGELWDALPILPKTQISVALSFLQHSGCLVRRWERRDPAKPVSSPRNYPIRDFGPEEATILYRVLAEHPRDG